MYLEIFENSFLQTVRPTNCDVQFAGMNIHKEWILLL